MYLSRIMFLSRLACVVLASVLNVNTASAAVFNVSTEQDFLNASNTAEGNDEDDTIIVSAVSRDQACQCLSCGLEVGSTKKCSHQLCIAPIGHDREH